MDAAAPDYVRLAERIERDIRARRLRPGDRCPSTAQMARRLGAGTAAVNRALQLLVRRGVVRRKQRVGTVVERAGTSPLKAVHIVVAREAVEAEGLFRDGTLLGLQEALPSAALRFEFTPPDEDAAAADLFVRGLVGGSEKDAGFVLVRSSLALQRAVEALGLPAVLSGSRYPSVRALPYVNRDNRQIGRLLAGRMLRRRRRRFLALLRARHTPGDDLFLDAVRETLDRAGLGAGALTTRSLPVDPDVVREEVRVLLAGTKGPTAVLCRNVPMAEAAADGARAARAEVDLAVCDYFPHAGGPAPRCAYTRCAWSAEEIGRRLGAALLGRASVDVPMELVEP